MSNEDIVRKFFSCYQSHDFEGMQSCLDENVQFSDFAFDIQGNQVRAMWHWFCIPFLRREEPVDVTKFDILRTEGDVVEASYRVSYLYGDKQRPVIYFINASFVIQNDKIVKQTDTFGNISENEFAEMALGSPAQFFISIQLFKNWVKGTAIKKLNKFMQTYKY
jgi:hypothetical protein